MVIRKWSMRGAVLIALVAIGCDSKTPAPQGSDSAQSAPSAEPFKPLLQKTEIIDWCREHGVPESVCTRCNASLIDGFKAKTDWCNEHGLPESQCFTCHPELQKKFADEYKAKYGKEPPSTQPA